MRRDIIKKKAGMIIYTCILAFIMAAFMSESSFAAKKVGEFDGHPLYEEDESLMPDIIDGGGYEGMPLLRAGLYPAKRDPRTNGGVTAIENQGDIGACWVFSATAAMECNLIKNGYANSNLDLSENHLMYFLWNRQTDPLGLTVGDYNIVANTAKWSDGGGNGLMIVHHLSTWSGMVRQTGSEDNADGTYKPVELPASDCYKSEFRLKNAFYSDYNVNVVKRAITDYGAVMVSVHMPRNDTESARWWNAGKSTMFVNDKEAKCNHGVTIVGWDDSYSRMNFNRNCRPSSDGAWIVKNSYGTKWGDAGYYYLSYEDRTVFNIFAFEMEPASRSYAKNYQYDGSASPGAMYKYTGVNVFKTNSTGNNEVLRAVSFETLTSGINYTVQIYTGVTDVNNPTGGSAKMVASQTGSFSGAGLIRVTLNTPVYLEAKEKFAVVITAKTFNGAVTYLMADRSSKMAATTDMLGGHNFYAQAKSGQSFIKYNNKWYDIGRSEGANLRIKAYTDNTSLKTRYKLSSKNTGVSKGSSETLKLMSNPVVNRKVAWSSSNKNVVKISSSGKMTGKKFGTSTIKAKFVSGGSKKTLKCKVTVGPAKVKGLKVTGGNKKITVKWKKSGSASGYNVVYSNSEDGAYKTLATVKSGGTTKCSKKKLAAGVYYVKLRPYMQQGKTKLYGSYTPAKQVVVK